MPTVYNKAETSRALYVRPADIQKRIDKGELMITRTYNGSNLLTTESVVVDGVTYVRTTTYTGNNPTGVSTWVKQ